MTVGSRTMIENDDSWVENDDRWVENDDRER